MAKGFRTVLMKVFTVVGAIVTAVVALGMVGGALTCITKDSVPDQTVLEIRLERPLAEVSAMDPLAEIFDKKSLSLHGLVEVLDRAATDDRVSGIIAYVGEVNHGMARTQEIRDAVLRFRESGKFAIAYAETFGELGPGNQGYYLATAFDEIWIQPSGGVGLTGLMAESPFVKGTLEMVGVRPHGDHRREYKNAFNMFTERHFTDAHREAAQALVDDMFGQMVKGIAERRGMTEDEVRAVVDKGPYLAPEALEAKLVDKLAYRDEAVAEAKSRAGEDAKLLYPRPYIKRAKGIYRDGDKVALVYGLGNVHRGPSTVDPLSGSSSMGSDTVAAAIRAAVADEDVKAIVFRVDSPGGSAVASDTIWRETVKAKEAGKPVIVSMGNVAASGGYYVSAAATKIVAQPATITGSIGVLGGKPVVRQMWNKLGVTWDSVHTSENADMWSSLQDYNSGGWERLQGWLDQVYADFKQRVADGRGIPVEKVEDIARGRVWTGERALAHGLVDELGGLTTAIRLAKSEAGIEADAEIELQVFPPRKEFLEQLTEKGPESSEDRPTAAEVSTAVHRWRDVAARIQSLGITEDPDVLTMQPIAISP